MDIYKQNIIDHYKHPRNYGTIENADYELHEVNTLCGDGLRFFIKLDQEKERILEASFVGEGCAISQAAASMLSEELAGMKLTEVKGQLTKEFILELLGIEVNPARMKCALLSLECIHHMFKQLKASEHPKHH
ncbi:MAG: iron-sulfur cluster assembly scaffold protein [Candidatus Dojkabacteria bacterium]